MLRNQQIIIVDPDYNNPVAPTNFIFTQWRLFLLILRFIGSCPMKMKVNSKTKSNRNIHFEFHLISWITLYTALMNALRVSLCILYFRDWARIVLGRGYRDTLEDWIVRAMNISMPFYQCWDMFCVWLTIKKAVKACNNWVHFETRFCSTFGSHYQYSCSLQKYRRLLLLATCVPVAVVLGLFLIDLFSTFGSPWTIAGQSQNETLIDKHWFSIPNELYFLPVPIFVFTTVLEEVKILLMYRTLSEAYLNLRKGIRSEIRQGNLLTEEGISEWSKILRMIRKQGKLTGRIQAPQQTVVLVHTIIIFTESLFIFIKSTMMNRTIKYFWLSVGISFTYVVRILAKILLADQVTEEEQRLADKIRQIDPTKLDLLGKLETKKITDLILMKPMKISLAGFVVLDKRMVPKILSYILAYLVVLFQFQLGNGFDIQTD